MDSASPEKKQVRVNIFNQSYTLVASSGETSEVEELAHYVDELMSGIASRAGNIDSGRVAVLACLHLADRLRVLEKDLTRLKQEVDAKSRQFSGLLDSVIADSE